MHPKDAPSATPEQCLHEILDVITSVRNGYFTCRLREEMPGDAGKIAKVMNELLALLEVFRNEHHRLTEEIGVTGRLGGQVVLPDCNGAWREMANETNRMGINMTSQVRDWGNVLRDHLKGETQSRMTCTLIAGELLELRELLNEHLDRVTTKAAS